MNEMVKNKLYSEENTGTEVTGDKTFIVKAMCTNSSDEEIPQDFTVQASSPEDAKSRAMSMSKEMDHKSCKVSGVDLVPNSDEALHKMGSGSALNANPSDTADQVLPSEVSADLPNGDAKA